MRIQRVVLEYHRDVSVFGLYIVYYFITDFQGTASDVFQAGDHTKSCRFTAARRTNENDKFFVFDFQIKILYSFKAVGIGFVDVR